MCENIENLGVSRRGVIKTLGVGLITTPALVMPTPAQALLFSRKNKESATPSTGGRERTLKITNKNTNEIYQGTYWKNGYYVPDELAKFDHLLRDHRQNKVRPMDTNLLDLAHDLQIIFDGKDINVISAYRCKKTNDMLRRRSGKKVAKNSYHIKAMALDIRVPGVPTKAIREAAKIMAVGGVGWYARQGFVHIDSGPVRYWSA